MARAQAFLTGEGAARSRASLAAATGLNAVVHNGVQVVHLGVPVVHGIGEQASLRTQAFLTLVGGLRSRAFLSGADIPADMLAALFSNAQTFGGAAFSHAYAATLFANAQAFGAHELSIEEILAEFTVFENDQSFGTHAWSSLYAATSFANAQTFGTHALTEGDLLTATLFANQQEFHGGEFSRLLTGELFANLQAFGTHSLSEPDVLTATLFANVQSFGDHAWSHLYAATKAANAQAFGDHAFSATLTATLHQNAQVYGNHAWSHLYQATKAVNAQVFGEPAFSHSYALTKWANAQDFKAAAWSHLYDATKHVNAQAFGDHEISEAGPLFQEEWAGTNGAAWNSTRWPRTAVSSTSLADIQSNAGRMLPQGAAYAAVRKETDLVVTDFDLTVQFMWQGSGEQYHGIYFRGGEEFPETPDKPLDCYVLEISASNDFDLIRCDDGVNNALATPSNTWAVETYNVRIQAIGSAIKAKFWQGTEPGAWNIEVTDATYSSGTFGFYSFNGNAVTARPFIWDNLLVVAA